MKQDTGAGDDKPFLGHLEELRRLLLRCLAGYLIALAPGFYLAPKVISVLSMGVPLCFFTVFEPFVVELKTGLLLALVFALPYIIWETGRYLAPALTADERRFLLAALGCGLALFGCGGMIAYVWVLPKVLAFALSFANDTLTPVIGLAGYLELVISFIFCFSLAFELPLVVLALVRLGIVRPATIRRRRGWMVVLIFVAAAILTPPDVISQLCMALPMWALFELSLLFAGRFAPAAATTVAKAAAPPPETVIRRKIRAIKR